MHSLGERAALSNGHDVPLLHVLPAGRAVHRHVLVSLLVTSLKDEDRATEHGSRHQPFDPPIDTLNTSRANEHPICDILQQNFTMQITHQPFRRQGRISPYKSRIEGPTQR